MKAFNPFSLENKIIIITGASSGIGRQCAISCSKMGATVVLIARNEERLKETLSEMDSQEKHLIYSYDLNNISNIKGIINEAVDKLGRLDGFIHAAGMEKTLPFKLLKENDYEMVYRTNVLSGLEIAKFFSHKDNHNQCAKILFISSISGVVGRAGVAAYAASKGALISVTRSLALELASKNINVNCISPGTILTPMMENYLLTLSLEDQQKRKDGFPLGLGVPDDIANTAIFLLSDAARWITGQNIIVDGGYTAK